MSKTTKRKTASAMRRRGAAPGSAAREYKANFLWPHNECSVQQAGYEFANAKTESYRKIWWKELLRLARMQIR